VSWIGRVAERVAPVWTLKRRRARIAVELLARNYEAASVGRRTQGWRRSMTDANSAIGPSLATLRDIARDLVRNNPYAESALSTIVDHVVGWGIAPATEHEAFERWARSAACDVHGRNTFAGLQRLAMRGVAESGEVLARRVWRSSPAETGLPFQIQLLEADYLDTLKDGATQDGGRIIQGVEFNARRERVAYWLYPEHPGARSYATSASFPSSQRIEARDVLHVFRQDRPGQVRAPTWFAPVLLTFKDFDELADATLVKQKVAACLAIVTTDVNGSSPYTGKEDPQKPLVDTLSPGMMLNAPVGRDAKVVEPPSVREYPDFARITLRGMATGLGCTYEDMTGDYTDLPFSAARMSRLKHQARVDDWRWNLLVPQFCDGIWRWAMEAAAIMGLPVIETTEWTAPPLPMVDPDKEGLAVLRNIRTGISTPSEAIRERGYEPQAFLRTLAADWKLIDDLGLVLDSDARKMTQAGQLHPATGSQGEMRELRGALEETLRVLERKPARKRTATSPPALNGNGDHAPSA
jgi:lambda family phage portal protein